jgi:hypothetical protein
MSVFISGAFLRNARGIVFADGDITWSFDTATNTLTAEVSSAAVIPYDNTASGLTATNVQDAIDEIVALLP